MEPISSSNRRSSEEPTSDEIGAAACLPREPEPESIESPSPVQCSPSEPAVSALVDKYPAASSTAAPPTQQASANPRREASHSGVALSVGVNFTPPGQTGGAEASVGVVVDLSEPRVALFTSTAAGKAAAPAVSAGISGQVSLVD